MTDGEPNDGRSMTASRVIEVSPERAYEAVTNSDKMTTTVTFEAVPDVTEVTVRQEDVPEATPPIDANEGWIAPSKTSRV
ncbi:SRPBCC domain-containing protein [Halocatena marina]|uniref:SRPBCC domain-containing protein n=1 Tax=Halocatena marina TaxID=2934937 RepID=A0ABD5YSF9_9EURY